MTKCRTDPNFYLWHNEENIFFVMIYIDDLIITCDTKRKITWLKMELEG
jgi:hypothetical protein